MVKYIMFKEYNEWENASWLIFLPFEDNLQNLVKVEILRTIMNRIIKIQNDADEILSLSNSTYTLENIKIAKEIIDDTFDDYFEAINIIEEDKLSKLIKLFVGIYYEMVEFGDGVVYAAIHETKGYQLIYKGGIMRDL